MIMTERKGFQPKFARIPTTLNMDMFGLPTVKAIEEKPIGTSNISDCRHNSISILFY